jgi:hypothetical protein
MIISKRDKKRIKLKRKVDILTAMKIRFLSFFRDIFVHHTSSLEFRAKLLASVIAIKEGITECEHDILEEIAFRIYKNDPARAYLLMQVTKEYIDKIIEKNELDLNALIKNIDNALQSSKRFAYKINIKDLKRFLECSKDDEETNIIQKRIIEFLQLEIKEYSL